MLTNTCLCYNLFAFSTMLKKCVLFRNIPHLISQGELSPHRGICQGNKKMYASIFQQIIKKIQEYGMKKNMCRRGLYGSFIRNLAALREQRNRHGVDLVCGGAVVPSRDWSVVLHCCSRSPGSEVGKNTAAGRPAAHPEKSRRNPTAERRACQPGTPPTWRRCMWMLILCPCQERMWRARGANWLTLFSTLCCEVYMGLHWPLWMRCRDFSTCREKQKGSC